MTYSEKLKDPRWQKKRLEVLQRDQFKCRICNDEKNTLHVHHSKYSGDPWDVNIGDLFTVCKHCHVVLETKKDDSNIVSAIKQQTGGYVFITLVCDSGSRKLAKVYGVDKDGLSADFLYVMDIKYLD